MYLPVPVVEGLPLRHGVDVVVRGVLVGHYYEVGIWGHVTFGEVKLLLGVYDLVGEVLE